MSKVKVLSVATHRERMIDIFEASCDVLGYDLQLLGVGKKWRGFSWRFDLIKEALRDMSDEQVVLVCDAFDTVLLESASVLVDRFNGYKGDLLFTTEPNDFNPFIQYYRWRLFGTNIINGGTYVGRAGALRQFISTLSYDNTTDDQKLLSRVCSELPVDTDSLVAFHCPRMYRGELPTIKPCLISFPGNGEQQRFLNALEIDYTFTMCSDHWYIMWYYRLCHYLPVFFPELVCMGIGCGALLLRF